MKADNKKKSNRLKPEEVKIIRFFVDNPSSIDTARGISAWTNLDRNETQKILEDFSKKGILIAFRTSSTIGYSLSENKKTLKALKQILTAHAA